LATKEEIKELLGKSPDCFDAAILTFAHPVRSRRVGTDTAVGLSVQQPRSILTTVNDFNQFDPASQLWTPDSVNPNFPYFSFGGQ
ncbi:MAG: hypothetical protein K2X27_10285, partial [Candidatus Obscuribacterales bacterium]|nr:hypothetical protein [Candidatus Obscuribacterales bacterium]